MFRLRVRDVVEKRRRSRKEGRGRVPMGPEMGILIVVLGGDDGIDNVPEVVEYARRCRPAREVAPQVIETVVEVVILGEILLPYRMETDEDNPTALLLAAAMLND